MTLLATSPILTLHSGIALSNPMEFWAIVGSLQCLSFTRPDIAFVVNKLYQFMHQPKIEHWAAIKCLIQYLYEALDHGLLLHQESLISLHAFSDVD